MNGANMSDNRLAVFQQEEQQERRRFFRRSEDTQNLNEHTIELISTVANLKARVEALEAGKQTCHEEQKKIADDIESLKEVKSVVVAWSMVAGSISALIYSNFATVKKLFE